MSRILPGLLLLLHFNVIFAIDYGMFQDTEHIVEGRVIELPDAQPLVGVSVYIKGTTQGTVTDTDGYYRINVPEEATLVFSFVGYLTEEVVVGNQSVIDVELHLDIQSLEEVIVVGYGSAREGDITGAVSAVDGSELTKIPAISVQQSMQGRVSGVSITNTGSPGSAPVVRIRGVGTTGNSAPLYVVDGIPLLEGDAGLRQINPNDVESVSVLKDAAASAIYGSRGAYGVVLITTKRGKTGAPRVSFHSYYGVQSPVKTLDVLNTQEYVAFATDIQEQANQPVPLRISDPASLDTLLNYNFDYQDALFNDGFDAPIQDHSISISGGTDKANYLVSAEYFDQQGIILETGFKRYSVRLNTDFQVTNFLKVGESIAVSSTIRRGENGHPFNNNIVQQALAMAPYLPIYDPTAKGGFNGPDRIDGQDAQNPILVQELGKNNGREAWKLIGSLYAEITFLEGLKFRYAFGFDQTSVVSTSSFPAYQAGDFDGQDFQFYSENQSEFYSPVHTAQLSYNRDFGKLKLSSVAVLEKQTSEGRNVAVSGNITTTDDLQAIELIEAPIAEGSSSEYGLLSYAGRLSLDYGGKYLLSGSFRRDGSSRFGPDNKYGNFPAVSGGWRISEEGFMSNLSFLNDLKVRAGWGLNGSDRISNFTYFATWDPDYNYSFDEGPLQQGQAVRRIPNTQVQWEETETLNIGLDFALFENKLQASIERYSRKSRGLLFSVNARPSLGIDRGTLFNTGEVENKGWDIELTYFANVGPISLDLTANVSTVSNEFTELGLGNPINQTNNNTYHTRVEEGMPIGFLYGWKVDRLFQQEDFEDTGNGLELREEFPDQPNAQPGDIKFVDVDGNGEIDDDDRTNIGVTIPRYNYNFNADLSYRNFDLNIFLQGVADVDIYAAYRHDTEGMTRVFNATTEVLNRWTPENTSTDIPRGITGDPNNNNRISDRYVEKGDYLRVKNITLGYNLPVAALEKVFFNKITGARVYFTALNLLTFTGYSGYDPEIGAARSLNNSLAYGVDFGFSPQPRTFLLGVQIDL